MLSQPDTAFGHVTPAASYITRRHVVTVEAADLVHWESHALPVIPGGREQTTFDYVRFAVLSVYAIC